MYKKIEKILNWSLAIVLIGGVFWFQNSISEEYRNTAENGIDTVGIVFRRTRTGSVQPGTGSVGIKFVFFQDGNYVITNRTGMTQEEYEKAIVGMKYRVRYIPNESRIDTITHWGVNHRAIIYLNDPVCEEYRNIDSTRIWIQKTFDSYKKGIPGARPYKDIMHLLPDDIADQKRSQQQLDDNK